MKGNRIASSIRIPLSDLCVINNNGYVAGMIQNSQKKCNDVALWHSGTNQTKLILSNTGYSTNIFYQINDINQVILTDFQDLPDLFNAEKSSLVTKSYLYDPRFGLISLDGYTPVKQDEFLCLAGINNKGVIIGVIQSKKDSHGRGVLFEPIPEKIEKLIKKTGASE